MTMNQTHKIVLVETRDGCEMMETKPRYNVMLNGEKVGQLYFNMRGYCGCLPLPGGRTLSMPESSITAYRREVSRINQEAK